MELNCEFRNCHYLNNRYSCFVEVANLTEKGQVIKEFNGVHEEGKSHNDVRGILFTKTNVNYFPRGLQKHFPNLTHLFIQHCGIKEISKNDLKGLERFNGLWITNCELTSLPNDLLTEMPNLLTVSFVENKFEFASSELLKPLIGRQNVKVNFKGNKSIDAQFWPGSYNSLESLEKLMDLIDEKCIKPPLPTVSDPVNFNPKFKEMWLSGRFSDLTIIAGDKKFKVHKNVLGMENKVFAQILEDQNEATEIKIPDFSSDSVEALLKFIYTNEVSRDGNAKEIFDIADKFKVAAMKSIYEKIICDQLDEANAWETFIFAHRFSSKHLKEKAFQLIIKKIPEEVSNEFMEDPEELKKLIEARRVYEEILKKYHRK